MMNIGEWAQLGGTAVIGGFAIWVLYKMNLSKDKLIGNHLDHSTAAQREESKSKVKLAKSIQKLSDTIDKKIK